MIVAHGSRVLDLVALLLAAGAPAARAACDTCEAISMDCDAGNSIGIECQLLNIICDCSGCSLCDGSEGTWDCAETQAAGYDDCDVLETVGCDAAALAEAGCEADEPFPSHDEPECLVSCSDLPIQTFPVVMEERAQLCHGALGFQPIVVSES